MNNGSTVSADIDIRLVVPEEAVIPLVAGLHYCAGDPYAVRIAFHCGTGEPVEWAFGRELLAMGVGGASGVGDVRIRPSDESQGGLDGPVVTIEIASPYGQARFEAPARDVSDFLSRTYRVVPEGAEGEHIDIEEGLADLLRQAL